MARHSPNWVTNGLVAVRHPLVEISRRTWHAPSELLQYNFSKWTHHWRAEQGAWWRFAVTCLAYFFGILLASRFLAPVLVQFSFSLGGGELMQQGVSLAITGTTYLVGLLAFLLAKRVLSPGRPSVLSSVGASIALWDALQSAVIALGLFSISIIWRGQLGNVESRLAAYGSVEWVTFVSMIAVAIGVQATSEEIVFRGYVLPRVAAWTGPGIGVLVSAAAFAGLHLNVSLWGYVAIVAVGVAASISVVLSGNIGAAAGLHVVNNLLGLAISPVDHNAQVTVGYTLSLIVLLLVWLCWVELLTRKRRDTCQSLPFA